MNYEALHKAIQVAGGTQTALAKKMSEHGKKVYQCHIWNLLNRDKNIKGELAVQIEHATNGQVTRQDLRPDIFGQPNESA